jgi:hypothetical protein
MFRAKHSKFVYRVALPEQPSMWRFVLLSALLHIWLVVLFGNATGGTGESTSWSRTFFATLEPGVTGTTSTRGGAERPRQTPLAAASSPPPQANETIAASSSSATPNVVSPAAAVTATATAPLQSIEIDKIPAIAVEVEGAVTQFSVAPIVVAPLSPLVSSIAPAVSPIPPLRPSALPAAGAGEAGFAIYVPPIVERAAVVATPAPIPATPTLPTLAKPQVEREFANYVAPPVVPTAPAPSVAIDTTTMASPAVVVPAAPVVQSEPLRPLDVLPIAPQLIAPLTLRPTTKALDTYQPRAVDAVPVSSPPASSATAAAVTHVPSASTAQTAATLNSGSTSNTASVATPPPGVGASALLNSPLPLPLPPPATAGPSSTTPRLDLDQLRRRARDAAKDGTSSRGLLPFPTVANEAPKKDMQKIFDKALKRPDCREVYADLGLLAVVPLLRDAAKEGGCKW